MHNALEINIYYHSVAIASAHPKSSSYCFFKISEESEERNSHGSRAWQNQGIGTKRVKASRSEQCLWFLDQGKLKAKLWHGQSPPVFSGPSCPRSSLIQAPCYVNLTGWQYCLNSKKFISASIGRKSARQLFNKAPITSKYSFKGGLCSAHKSSWRGSERFNSGIKQLFVRQVVSNKFLTWN